MNYRWHTATPKPLLARSLITELSVSPLMAQCLVNRGLSEPCMAASFLAPKLRDLADPFLLPNMGAAVARLLDALRLGEKIVIFGDYDVDGVTSTTLLMEAMRQLGWHVEAYLPHRMDEGYGLTREGVENCLKRHPAKLLLAVDCGSTATETIGWLRSSGVDVIVLDHHQVSSPPPAANALVNPQLCVLRESGAAGGGPGVFTELCSVGLAFKLVHALVKRGRQLGLAGMETFDMRPLLDLVALGTIADLVPLRGENRILVTTGLVRLGDTSRKGLIALKEVAQVVKPIEVHAVGYQLGPRLNAAGRLENAERALHLLMAQSMEEATEIAHELDSQNRERQQIERNITDEVIGALRAKFQAETDYVIVEGQMLWHIGVVGIVASRVVREFHRPTLIVGGDAEQWRGSGRSIEGFDLAAALRECDDLLIRHGGHAMAAGITVEPAKLPELRTRLNDLARRALQPEQLRPMLKLDAEVTLDEITVESIEEIDRLQPCGQGNASVQLCARRLRLQRPPMPMGREKQHLKLWVTDGATTHEAVWWNTGKNPAIPSNFDLAFVPQINEFNGRHTVQLKVLDCHAV
ncbi:MAG: single-stranded-DNA-specific exonuclease RecJ [Pedosphaera sp.]|nr:single-stranded-DNA-specific exonuclease RecJ [Pedosphaera sp.]